MATLYRYTDSGAPTKPAAASYNGASWFMSIVKACLVTGYGSKAAAGWTIVYEDTTTNARRMALSNGNGVVEFVTWGNTSMAIFIWDSITTAGTGRIYDTAWATAVSTGVNGWGAQNAKLPSSTPITLIGVDFVAMMADALNSQWSIVADDKSMWIDFHYALNHSNAEPGDGLVSNINWHPKLFLGALNSPDLPRGQFGNFFAISGSSAAASSAAAGGYSGGFTNILGLRTPLNLIPVTNTEFTLVNRTSQIAGDFVNIRDAIRLIQPQFLCYRGAGKPAPAGLNSSYGYTFATVPGVGLIAPQGYDDFWRYYSAENAVSSNLEIFTINSVPWVPFALAPTNANAALTPALNWWTA